MNARTAGRGATWLGVAGAVALLISAGFGGVQASDASFTPRLEIELTRTPEGTVIRGTTNLPDHTELHYTISLPGKPPIGGGVLTIMNRLVSASPISIDGKALPPGNYEFGAGCANSDIQPEAVNKLFGEHGKNLEGPLAQSYGNTIRIVYKAVLTVQQ